MAGKVQKLQDPYFPGYVPPPEEPKAEEKVCVRVRGWVGRCWCARVCVCVRVRVERAWEGGSVLFYVRDTVRMSGVLA